MAKSPRKKTNPAKSAKPTPPPPPAATPPKPTPPSAPIPAAAKPPAATPRPAPLPPASAPIKAAPAPAPTPATPPPPSKPASKPTPPAPVAPPPPPPPAPRPVSTPSQPAPTAAQPAATKPLPPKPAASPKSAAAKRAPAAPPPPILVEGDASPTPAPSGPGQRYALGATRPASPTEPTRSLPAAYGTGRLLVAARDPRWIYVHWDLTDDQLKAYNRKSAAGHLAVRVYESAAQGTPLLTQDVHPESRNWFINVPRAGAAYVAELGYLDAKQQWQRVAVSGATVTPADALSAETWVRYETLPFDVPMTQLVELVKQAVAEHIPLLEAIQHIRRTGTATALPVPLPPPGPAPAPVSWSPEQERALAELISIDDVRRVWIGSLEITELLRRQLLRGISSGELPIQAPSLPAGISSLGSLSSPFGGAPAQRGFWFNVNAELIVYGATQPDATVTIGGRRIQLRPDGTFSYRFALPDGNYDLPIVATSPDAVEQRSADLNFSRTSTYKGDVGAHPQDASLRPPSPQNVA